MADEILLSKGNYWKIACLNAALRGIPFTLPEHVYLALYVSDPTDADTGQEITGGGYARVQVTFAQATISNHRGVTSNSADVVFPIATADQGIASYIGIRDAAIGGNLIYHGSVTKPRSILENDLVRFLSGQLVIDEG